MTSRKVEPVGDTLPDWRTATSVFVAVSAQQTGRGLRAYLRTWSERGPHMAATLGVGLLGALMVGRCSGAAPSASASRAFDDVQTAALVQETCDDAALGSTARTVAGEWGCYDPTTGELLTAVYSGATSGATPTPAGEPQSAAPPDGVLPAVLEWWDEIHAAATAHGVPPRLFACLVQQESGGQASISSPAGAVGLAQIMPATGEGLGLSRADLLDPVKNLDGGARYLAAQFKAFGDWRTALAAYNSGPGGARRSPWYAETQRYVAAIMPCWGGEV